jgi:hypothetical protein
MEEVFHEAGFTPLRLLGKNVYFLEFSTPDTH